MIALASHNTIILIITNLKSTSLHLYISTSSMLTGTAARAVRAKGAKGEED